MKKIDVENLVKEMRAGNVRALSRLMTLVETKPESAAGIMKAAHSSHKVSRRIGISGPPGAGKSTLVSNLIDSAVRDGQRVGALCIDPTSPLTGGAILGDRVRLSGSFDSRSVFIRSVASGESLGGLAEATRLHTFLLESFGFDLVLIETVGLGQVGYDIRNIAETLILILVPESGDTVQILKSGIIELADIVVVNKSDRDGADEIAASLHITFSDPKSGWTIPVIKAVARNDVGTEEIREAARAHLEYLESSGEIARFRDPGASLMDAIEKEISRRVRNGLIDGAPAAAAIAKAVSDGERDPFSSAAEIADIIFGGMRHE
ncbi:MAG TPA: methylmalonyl Co-A mutase-associated GTPase MeaB [bacterium]|nr:methylmalonyl Co-A mutase-associated GTPase MeaB [bacterium]